MPILGATAALFSSLTMLDESAAASPATSSSSRRDLIARPLSRPEMESVVGGVATSAFTPSTSPQVQSVDNPLFSMTWSNGLQQNSTYTIFADSTKVAPAIVATANGTGSWATRTLWPVSNVNRQLTTKYFSNSQWNTSYTGPLVRINPSIKMINVRLWNSTIGGVTTAVTVGQMAAIFDVLDGNASYNWTTTASVDGIFSQCFDEKRMQFRMNTTVNTINLSSCTNPMDFWPADACQNQAYNLTTSNGTDFSNLNIVAVPSGSIGKASAGTDGTNAFHIRSPDSNPTRYWIAFEENLAGLGAVFGQIMAHEVGHWILYPNSGLHAEDNGVACSGNTPNNNLMCRWSSSGGRLITTTQCSNIATNQPAYYRDQN